MSTIKRKRNIVVERHIKWNSILDDGIAQYKALEERYNSVLNERSKLRDLKEKERGGLDDLVEMLEDIEGKEVHQPGKSGRKGLNDVGWKNKKRGICLPKMETIRDLCGTMKIVNPYRKKDEAVTNRGVDLIGKNVKIRENP
jgi:hypothetical protein